MANPIISRVKDMSAYGSGTATYAGVAGKSVVLVGIVTLSAIATWIGGYASPITTGVTAIMALIAAMAISFRPGWAAFLAPLYAILEGMCLASISVMFNHAYPGIVINAMLLTFSLAIGTALIYAKGYVKVDDGFIRAVSMATLGIFLTYLLEFILGFFGVRIPMIHQSGLIGIIFSLVIVGIATFNLFIDYEQINQSVRRGMPSEYEWFCAFSLLVTLVWMYIEILDLLRKLKDD